MNLLAAQRGQDVNLRQKADKIKAGLEWNLNYAIDGVQFQGLNGSSLTQSAATGDHYVARSSSYDISLQMIQEESSQFNEPNPFKKSKGHSVDLGP